MTEESVLTYVGIAMAIGTIGNALVIYIFGFRYRKSPFNMLITILAIYDLLSCIIHMPLDIVGMLLPEILPHSIFCKAACTMVSVTMIAASIVLIAIAIMRYRGVSKPLSRNIDIREAKGIGILAIIPAVGLSWPIIFMFTTETITSKEGRKIAMCGIHDKAYTTYALAFHSVLLGLFLVNFISLVVFYLVIARVMINRNKVFAQKNKRNRSIAIASIMEKSDQTSTGNTPGSTHDSKMGMISAGKKNSITQKSMSLFVHEPQSPKSERLKPAGRCRERSSANNGLLMMFLVTILFLCSYLPHLGYSMYFLLCSMDDIINLAVTASFGVLVRSYYMNSFSNPIIYALCSGEFRFEVAETFRRLFRLKS
ncbi:gastrin/cholecystokinin type B receptor [Patella vulgata]|uniref:gastrin/cholecystokinin type B receptor n=1 Tax=Patella vulgata TaxID=6465 RepID=UPI00218084E7|nr:gastrin/cholecystokinin type B receptor [Patella vulgata]